jgi:hypothetical protein
MPGPPAPRPLDGRRRGVFLLTLVLLSLAPLPAAARELRQQMPFVRPLLMGGAYVAVADEGSVMFFNPAGLARIRAGSTEAFSLQFSADKNLSGLLLNPGDVQNKYAGLSPAQLASEIGNSLFFDVSMWAPLVVDPEAGRAWGLGLQSMGSGTVVDAGGGVPALELETFIDQVLVYSLFHRSGPLMVGINAKLINRSGVNKTIDAATLYSGGTLDLNSDPDFAAAASGESRARLGADLGLLYELPFAPDWQPRVGLALLNVGGREGHRLRGIEFGARPDPITPPLFGEMPINLVLGFAVSPTYNDIRYTVALDVVDVARSAIEGDSINVRTRLGFAMEFGPHEDGTALFSLLAGWNATHFGFGVLSRVSAFEIGFGRYKIERGSLPGEDVEDRRVLIFSVRI